MFYDGGGVTFTGGEATMQFEPLRELFIRLKGAGLHTAIETNGSHPRLPELFPYIDQLIMDCKHWDREKHKEYTGVSIETVLKNLKAAVKEHGQLDVRVPLVGGVNDSEEDMERFAGLFETLRGDKVTFEILKYHEFGKNKWEQCGWVYGMDERAHVTAEQVRHFRELIKVLPVGSPLWLVFDAAYRQLGMADVEVIPGHLKHTNTHRYTQEWG